MQTELRNGQNGVCDSLLGLQLEQDNDCLLYTSDAADENSPV